MAKIKISEQKWDRIVVKVGTSLLTAKDGSLDSTAVHGLASQIVNLHKLGVKIVLVTSGAVTAGQEVLNWASEEPSQKGVASRQVLASLGQVPLMREYSLRFSELGVAAAQALVSRSDLESNHGYLNTRNTLLGLLKAGAVPIVNENDVVAIEELEGDIFGDNDRLSARVSDVVDADMLIILSDVDGFYNRDPHRFPGATKLDEVSVITPTIRAAASGTFDSRGRGGMTTKLDAAEIATSVGISVVVASGTVPNILMKLHSGEKIGTFFPSRTTRIESRKRRILASLNNKCGSVTVNSGAERAITQNNASLLSPGITGINGSFERGDCIAIRNNQNQMIAAGRSSYSSENVLEIRGLQSREARKLLANDYGDAVIHRNNMVVVKVHAEKQTKNSGLTTKTEGLHPDLQELGSAARKAAKILANVDSERKNQALNAIANALVMQSERILDANRIDIVSAEELGVPEHIRDRLLLTPERIETLAKGVTQLIDLEDPVGETINESVRPNGLRIERQRIPLGVIGVIYESRPNITVDIAVLCLKAGNAVILRGGSESFESNRAFASLIRGTLCSVGIPQDAVQFINSKDRGLVDEMLALDQYIDLLIPRGGDQLMNMVSDKAKMPYVTGGIGVCHTYVDHTADVEMAVKIVHNAKVQRPSVCNALDTLIVHFGVADRFIPAVAKELWRSGVELRCDQRSADLLEKCGDYELLKLAGEADYDTEFLGLTAAIRIVDSIDEAIAHIELHGSNHSEAIITQDNFSANRFRREVDASAIFVNASTRFNDGYEFGLGAEVAISTNKLHAYGPMGLREITSYKWVVTGTGQVRS